MLFLVFINAIQFLCYLIVGNYVYFCTYGTSTDIVEARTK